MSQFLEAALNYASRGIPVFPIAEGAKKPPKVSGGFKAATTDEEQIREWWTRWPNANIAAATGPGTGIVLDVDFRHDGQESLEKLVNLHGEFRITRMVTSGTEENPTGMHIYFADDPKIGDSVGRLPGLDVRGSGTGYIMLPPSVKSDGTYIWEIFEDLVPVPAWFHSIFGKKQVASARPTVSPNTNEIRAAAQIALTDQLLRLSKVQPGTGQRHSKLNEVSYIIGRYVAGGGIPREYAENEIKGTFAKLNLGENKSKIVPEAEIERIIQDAFDAAGQNPVHTGSQAYTINYTPHDITPSIDAALNILRKENLVYQGASGLVAVSLDAMDKPYARRLTATNIFEIISRRVLWMTLKHTKDKSEYVPIKTPSDVCAVIAETHDPRLPVLKGFSNCPMISPDGILNMSPGYDAESGIWLDISTDYSFKQYSNEDAVAIFKDLLHDVPFAKEEDFSSYLLLVACLVARHYIKGPVPLFMIRAPQKGVGKTMLMDLAHIIATGVEAPHPPAAPTPEEEEKRIVAALVRGQLLYAIDNLDRPLGSGVLDAAITSSFFQGRILGRTETVNVPMNMVFVVTGNNPRFAGDITRRLIPVSIVPTSARPERRTNWRYPNIISHTVEHRERYINAILSILLNYREFGPLDDVPVMGSFVDMSKWVAAAVQLATGNSPIRAAREYVAEEDEDYSDREMFLHCWFQLYGNEGVTAVELKQLMDAPESVKGDREKKHSLAAAARLHFDDYTPNMSMRSFGRCIGRLNGAIIGKYKLVKGVKTAQGSKWHVEEIPDD